VLVRAFCSTLILRRNPRRASLCQPPSLIILVLIKGNAIFEIALIKIAISKSGIKSVSEA